MRLLVQHRSLWGYPTPAVLGPHLIRLRPTRGEMEGLRSTHGVLTQTDHVRVAVGRHDVDATPTSGTISVGGGRETLEVSVVVEPSAVRDLVLT